MSLFKYIVIQSFEYLSLFIFILVQFRFSLKENITQIGLISLLLSFVSHSFIDSGMNGIFPLIQLIFVMLYIQLVMKVSIINALIMFFTGYIVFGVAQVCILAAAMHLGIVQGNVDAGTNDAYLIQVITILLMSLLSFVIFFYKGGFSFIEARSRFSKVSFTGKNRTFALFIGFAFIVSIIANIFIVEGDNPPLLGIAFINLILLLILFYLSIRRDEVDDRTSLQSSSNQVKRN